MEICDKIGSLYLLQLDTYKLNNITIFEQNQIEHADNLNKRCINWSRDKAANFRECIMSEIDTLRNKFTEELKDLKSKNKEKESYYEKLYKDNLNKRLENSK